MESSQNYTNTYQKTHSLQHAEVKRTHALEQQSQPLRKSARLEKLREETPTPMQQQKPVSRKQPRTQNDQGTPEGPSIEQSTLVPALPGNDCEGEQLAVLDPISYWAANKQWPRQFLDQGKYMGNILARRKSVSSKSPTAASFTNQAEQMSRAQKNAEYKEPWYSTLLTTKGVFMKSSSDNVSKVSQDWCQHLLEQEQSYPQDTLFQDNLFSSTCQSLHSNNDTRTIRDIALLIVPSAEIFTIRGATHLQCLIESVNEGWDNSIPITKTVPQPDYTVGFRREAFTQEQLDRMSPVVGDFDDMSYFMATWYIYFPFLTCEVTADLDLADRQNAHSTAIAVRAVVELFRVVKRDKEVHREILAFSISHDNDNVRIYGHYAEIDDAGTKYFRHPIRAFCFAELEGRQKWTAYKFTKNVYDHWMPMHFKRICSAIDEFPTHMGISASH